MKIRYKKIFFGIILFGILISLVFNESLKKYEETSFYELTTPLKNIDIDIDNFKITIATSNKNEISIKRLTTQKKADAVKYSANYTDGTLKIKQYNNVTGKNISKAKDELIVLIPENLNLDNIEVKSVNSTVKIENLTSENLKIENTKKLKVNLNNSKFSKTNIRAAELESESLNDILTDEIIYNVKSAKINNNNVGGGKEFINATGVVEYENDSSHFAETNFAKGKYKISYVLDKDKNYSFVNIKNPIDNKKFISKMKTSTYMGNAKNSEIYKIDMNSNKLNNWSFAKTT